jgi:hypothetical protein
MGSGEAPLLLVIQEDDACTVEIAMRRDLRKYGKLSVPLEILNWILDMIIRYGNQTGRALGGIVVSPRICSSSWHFGCPASG